MSKPFAISLSSPSGLSTAEFGPLVRAQPVDRPSAGGALYIAALLGLNGPVLLGNPGAGMVERLTLVAPFAVWAGLAPLVRKWGRRRRMRLCPIWDGAALPSTSVVRIRGRVQGIGEAFQPPGESQPVIFAHTEFPQPTGVGRRTVRFREDVRGVFLQIHLATGASVRIAPEAVRLVDGEKSVPEVGDGIRYQLGAPWAGLLRGRLRRSILRAGDLVEAVGKLEREVGVEGVAAPGRGVPMIQWLVPAWKGGVWIRRLEETGEQA
jgi:hypothetical protein